jgi:2-oxoglutarate ferredoxin oxidoreductase subunit beta
MVPRAPITAAYEPGTLEEVVQHDGSVLRLRKVTAEYDPSDRIAAMNFLQQHDAKGEVVTGLLYVDTDPEDLHAHLNTVETPFNQMSEPELCPGPSALDRFNASLR